MDVFRGTCIPHVSGSGALLEDGQSRGPFMVALASML